MKRSLLVGCGNSRVKKVCWKGEMDWVGQLTTIDMDPNCGADVVMSLDGLGSRSWRHPFGKRLPFPDETFDEIGCYDVLEHVGRQGDWRGWFDEMGEYHRVLKPGGTFGIIVPVGENALADPGHTRFFQTNYFGFLSQEFYRKNLMDGAAVTDYRWYWKKNFDVAWFDRMGDHHIACVLRRT